MPIVNVPTADHYETVAKNSMFSGLVQLLSVIEDFEQYFEAVDGSIADERKEYYANCQVELERVCVFISQACELALKAKVCSVSPYLLLLGNEPNFKTSHKDLDFSDFRTLDAVDLPNAVGSLTSVPLTDAFIQRYTHLRRLRNKITHLGVAGAPFDPDELFSILIEQYVELWPGSRLLADWHAHLSGTRYAFFYDGKYSSAGLEMAGTLDTFFTKLPKSQFKMVFGFPKTKRRYTCLVCWNSEALRRSSYAHDAFRVGHLEDETTLRCMVCEGAFKVSRIKCVDLDCKGNVICAEGDFEGCCHLCGHDQSEEPHSAVVEDHTSEFLGLFGKAVIASDIAPEAPELVEDKTARNS